MKNPLKRRTAFLGGSLFLIIGLLLFLFFDAFYGGDNFRTMQDGISSAEGVDLRGLREIQASGGNAPRFAYLNENLRSITQKKIIVDAMCEPHGYIKGIPTTFFGYQRRTPSLHHLIRRLIYTGTIKKRPELVTPEIDETKKYGFAYKNINIGSKFTATNEHIDDIVNFFYDLPENVWVHIHCINGKGRTSIVLVMLDIMKNAPTVSLENIIKRQYLLGSVDLFDTVVWKRGTYDKQQLENRSAFIKRFYEFVSQRKAGGPQKWSEWYKMNPPSHRLSNVR